MNFLSPSANFPLIRPSDFLAQLLLLQNGIMTSEIIKFLFLAVYENSSKECRSLLQRNIAALEEAPEKIKKALQLIKSEERDNDLIKPEESKKEEHKDPKNKTLFEENIDRYVTGGKIGKKAKNDQEKNEVSKESNPTKEEFIKDKSKNIDAKATSTKEFFSLPKNLDLKQPSFTNIDQKEKNKEEKSEIFSKENKEEKSKINSKPNSNANKDVDRQVYNEKKTSSENPQFSKLSQQMTDVNKNPIVKPIKTQTEDVANQLKDSGRAQPHAQTANLPSSSAVIPVFATPYFLQEKSKSFLSKTEKFKFKKVKKKEKKGKGNRDNELDYHHVDDIS